jgi:hypothetical protein
VEEWRAKPVLTVAKTADLLICSKARVYQLIKEGVLDALDVLGKTGIKTGGVAAILDGAKKKELDRARVAAANAARRASGAATTSDEQRVAAATASGFRAAENAALTTVRPVDAVGDWQRGSKTPRVAISSRGGQTGGERGVGEAQTRRRHRHDARHGIKSNCETEGKPHRS